MWRRSLTPAICLVAILLLAGCGDGYQLAAVSGRVNQGGQPVPELHVTFQPLAGDGSTTAPGPASVGQTDAQGVFHLRTIGDGRGGAVVGRHVVTIVPVAVAFHDSESGDPPPSGAIQLPRRFSDGSLHFDVPAAGTDAANFTWDDPGGR